MIRLRRIVTPALVVLAAPLAFAAPTLAAPANAEGLEEAIDRVLERPEYSWRTPPPESETGIAAAIRRFFEATGRLVARFVEWLEEVGDWWSDRFDDDPTARFDTGVGDDWILWLLVATGLVTAAIVVWLLRSRAEEEPIDETVTTAPSLEEIAEDESEAASVPSERWRQWARDLEAQGRPREAIRALYLAALSHLSDGGLLRLQRHKSNRDYRRELARRAQSDPPLSGRFGECVATFDRVWYGRHEPTAELTGSMWRSVENIIEKVAGGR